MHRALAIPEIVGQILSNDPGIIEGGFKFLPACSIVNRLFSSEAIRLLWTSCGSSDRHCYDPDSYSPFRLPQFRILANLVTNDPERAQMYADHIQSMCHVLNLFHYYEELHHFYNFTHVDEDWRYWMNRDMNALCRLEFPRLRTLHIKPSYSLGAESLRAVLGALLRPGIQHFRTSLRGIAGSTAAIVDALIYHGTSLTRLELDLRTDQSRITSTTSVSLVGRECASVQDILLETPEQSLATYLDQAPHLMELRFLEDYYLVLQIVRKDHSCVRGSTQALFEAAARHPSLRLLSMPLIGHAGWRLPLSIDPSLLFANLQQVTTTLTSASALGMIVPYLGNLNRLVLKQGDVAIDPGMYYHMARLPCLQHLEIYASRNALEFTPSQLDMIVKACPNLETLRLGQDVSMHPSWPSCALGAFNDEVLVSTLRPLKHLKDFSFIFDMDNFEFSQVAIMELGANHRSLERCCIVADIDWGILGGQMSSRRREDGGGLFEALEMLIVCVNTKYKHPQFQLKATGWYSRVYNYINKDDILAAEANFLNVIPAAVPTLETLIICADDRVVEWSLDRTTTGSNWNRDTSGFD